VSAAQNSPQILTELSNKLGEKSLLTAKADEQQAAAALNTFAALANEAIIIAEPHLCDQLPNILAAAGSKSAVVRAAAEAAVMALATKMSANAVRVVLPHLFKASEIENAWQTRALALRTIAGFGDHAPEQLGFSLPTVVPCVTSSMTDTKKEVAEAARMAMTSSCDVIGNRDIEHMTSHIVRSFTNPEEVPEIMHSLAGVTFVQSVQSPALVICIVIIS